VRFVIGRFPGRGVIMSAICTSELLEGIPVVCLRMNTFSKVLEEYFRRCGDGKDWDRKISFVISGTTGVILLIKGSSRLLIDDEWYPIRRGFGNLECKFVGKDLFIRKQYWNKWIQHSHGCRSYPSTWLPLEGNKICVKSDIICVIDIVPDDQENYVPGDLYESIRS
jgi:hypothetical protein